jgi:hypothetical protein
LFKRLRPKLTFANVMVVILAFVVLGGGAYAATQIPRNSVGTAQLKNRAVTPKKLSKKTLATIEEMIRSYGLKLSSAPGPVGPTGPTGPTGEGVPPGGTIPAGTTLRGSVAPSVLTPTPGGSSVGQGVSFGGYQLAARPVAHVIPPGGPATAECPGSAAAPEAKSGHLCVYVTSTVPNGAGQVIVVDPSIVELSGLNYNLETDTETVFADGTVSRIGFRLSYSGTTSNSAQFLGTWAVTG